MTEKELLLLLNQDEKEDLEFKEGFGSTQISKTACAFANMIGGNIILGVSHKKTSINEKILGVTGNLDTLQRSVEDAIRRVTPTPIHQISLRKIGGKTLLVVSIQRIGETACTFSGAVYIRIGSTNQKLEGHGLTEFLKSKALLCFDTIPSKAKLKDINLKKFNDYLSFRSSSIKAQESNIKELLRSLQFASENGEFKLKNAAVLSFCNDAADFFPQNEIKLVRFKGTKPVEIIDNKTLNESPISGIKSAIDFILRHTSESIQIKDIERSQKSEYPFPVIREAIVNAIAHRDYFSNDAVQVSIFSNRLEITSPGSLPKGLTMDKLGGLSVQRNPITYRILRDAKHVEGLGTGIPRMYSLMREENLPDPFFEDLGNFFRVTLSSTKVANIPAKYIEILNERQKVGYTYIVENKAITSKEYARLNGGISIPTAVSDLNHLMALGILKRHGKMGKGTHYTLKTKGKR